MFNDWLFIRLSMPVRSVFSCIMEEAENSVLKNDGLNSRPGKTTRPRWLFVRSYGISRLGIRSFSRPAFYFIAPGQPPP